MSILFFVLLLEYLADLEVFRSFSIESTFEDLREKVELIIHRTIGLQGMEVSAAVFLLVLSHHPFTIDEFEVVLGVLVALLNSSELLNSDVGVLRVERSLRILHAEFNFELFTYLKVLLGLDTNIALKESSEVFESIFHILFFSH